MLWEVLGMNGTPGHLITTVQSLYCNIRISIALGDQTIGRNCEINQGVRQGYPL